MVAINANINASKDWLPLSEADALSLPAGYYTIDSEDVDVQGIHFTGTRTTTKANGRWVKRGYAGSTAASHTSGATLTRYYPEAPGGEGGVTVDNTVDAPFTASTIISAGATESGPDEATLAAAGEQVVTLLGPFTVEHDTAGFVNPAEGGLPTLTIPAGSLFQCFAVLTETWTGDSGVFALLLNAGITETDFVQMVGYQYTDLPVTPAYMHSELDPDGSGSVALLSQSLPRRAIALQELTVYAAGYPFGAVTAGAFDIYALIATPA